MRVDFSPLKPVSIWQALEAEEPSLESLELGSTDNTEPTNDKIHIPRELIGDWSTSDTDPFPDRNDLIAYAQERS